MLFEELTSEDLGEDVRRVVVCRHVAYANLSGAALLSHLEQLTVDVPRVLRGSETVTEIVRPFVIGSGDTGRPRAARPPAHKGARTVEAGAELSGVKVTD